MRTPVSSLLASITSTELTYWMAYLSLEPTDQIRHDIGVGIISSTIANCHSSKKFEVTDFMPRWEPKPPTPIEEVKAYFMSMTHR